MPHARTTPARTIRTGALIALGALLAGAVALGPAPAAQAWDTDFTVEVRSPHSLQVIEKWAASDDRFMASTPTAGDSVVGWSSHRLNLVFWWAKNNTGRITYQVEYTDGPGERIIVAAVPSWGSWTAQASCVVLPLPGQTARHTCVASGTNITITKRSASLSIVNHGGYDLMPNGANSNAGFMIPDTPNTGWYAIRAGSRRTIEPLHEDQTLHFGVLTGDHKPAELKVDFRAPTATSEATASCVTEPIFKTVPEHFCYLNGDGLNWATLDLHPCWHQSPGGLFVWKGNPEDDNTLTRLTDPDVLAGLDLAVKEITSKTNLKIQVAGPGDKAARADQTEVGVMIDPTREQVNHGPYCVDEKLAFVRIALGTPHPSPPLTKVDAYRVSFLHAFMHALGIGHPPWDVLSVASNAMHVRDADFSWAHLSMTLQPYDIAAINEMVARAQK